MSSKPFNVQLFKQRLRELEEVQDRASFEDFFVRMGAVTNTFELCENLLFHVLVDLDRRSHFVPLVFDMINSRATRSQILREFIAATQPKRVTKRYARVVQAFERYDELGKQRDEVAHGVVQGWTHKKPTAQLLSPPSHVRRKHIGGLPKYHYNLKKLDSLIEALSELSRELGKLMIEVGLKRQERMIKRTQQERLQTGAK